MFSLASASISLIEQHAFLRIESSSEYFPASQGQGLPLLIVTTSRFKAVIAFQGAHLLSFKPTAQPELLWVSPNCQFTQGTALRGGIPLCMPWFGPHPSDASQPKHGFARNRDWTLLSAQEADGKVTLTFSFKSEGHSGFANPFSATVKMLLSEKATIELSISNDSSSAFDSSFALHSYHPVSSLSEVRVKGLDGRTYLDNLSNHSEHQQIGDLAFVGEVDRVFPNIANNLIIEGSPRILIEHDNCPSVITWNPGAENAKNIADIGAGKEQEYICVERGAVLAEAWHIMPGETKTGALTISMT